LFREEKQALRQTNQELMERLKKLWNCYKEKSLERLCSSISSNSSTTSASVNENLKVCLSSSNRMTFFLSPFNCTIYDIFPNYQREEISDLQTNVEFLTNRVNLTSSVIAESNNYNVNEVYINSKNDIAINSNNVEYEASPTPHKYEDISHLTTSMPPPVENSYIEDNAINNYSNFNDMLPLEQNTRIESPPKRNSIKNVVKDDEYEALPFEPPTYIEQQPAGNPC
jgi:hypothetical protein